MNTPYEFTSSQEVIAAGTQYLLPTYAQQPIVITGGSGSFVYDMEGTSYLDFVAGIAVNALGYGDKELADTLKQVIDGGITHCSNLYWNPYAVEAARLLSRLSGLSQTFFCNSGAEANEAALKLARKFGTLKKGSNAVKIITMEQSFHGRTYGAITATGQPKYHQGFAPMVPGFSYGKFNDLEDIASRIDEETCAVMVEPIQGEGGIIPADPAFLQGLRALCDEHNLLLIFDEVQCGMGRTGSPFAFQQYDVIPDVITLAKGLGGGIPVGAMTVGPRAEGILAPGDHAATFGGNHLAAAAASVVLRRLENPSFLQAVQHSGAVLTRRLEQLKETRASVSGVRGTGLMQGIQLTIEAAPVISACKERGLLLAGAGKQVIRFVPPLVVSTKEIHQAMDILGECIPS